MKEIIASILLVIAIVVLTTLSIFHLVAGEIWLFSFGVIVTSILCGATAHLVKASPSTRRLFPIVLALPVIALMIGGFTVMALYFGF